MTIRLSNNRLQILNGTETRFDSDGALFHTITGGLTGNLYFPAITASATAIKNTVTTTNVGTCHAVCTHVIGSVYMEADDTARAGLPLSRWTTYMGGSIVWVMAGPGLLQTTRLDNSTPHTALYYAFSCSGGVVSLTQTLRMANSPNTYAIVGHRLRWSLEAGTFS